jgi:hypothetical protein
MKKTTLILINTVIILLIIFLYYQFVFQPSKQILENKVKTNFISDMTIESMVIDNSVSRYIEGTKSITSRSMIRKRILDYRNGEVTLKELKTYTQPKYQDGIKALEDCVYASRWVNQQQVAGYNQIRVNAIKNILADTSRQRLTSGFVLNDSHDNMLVYVISPIRPKDSHEVIGYDIALFSNPVLWQRI